MWFLEFLGTMILSCFIYCVPVLIYRVFFRGNKPIESKWKAQWISWIFWGCSYGAVCLFYLFIGAYKIEGFSAVPGIPDFLCLLISWVILFYDIKKTNANNPSPFGVTVCPGCGCTIKNGRFCSECGIKLPDSENTSAPNQTPASKRDILWVDSNGKITSHSNNTDPSDESTDIPSSEYGFSIRDIAIILIVFLIIIVFCIIVSL